MLNFPGENLLSVHVVTVCNKPLCSISERGVRCNDIVVGALKTKNKNKNEIQKLLGLSKRESNIDSKINSPNSCNGFEFGDFSIVDESGNDRLL